MDWKPPVPVTDTWDDDEPFGPVAGASILLFTGMTDVASQLVEWLAPPAWSVQRVPAWELMLDLAASDPPALAIVEVRVGDEPLAGIRELHEAAGIPILALTYLDLPEDESIGLVGALHPARLDADTASWAVRYALAWGRMRRRNVRDRRRAALVMAGEMAAAVAHDINNPLTTLLANLETALGADLDPEVREAVAEAKQGTETISAIVRDLSFLTKAHAPRTVGSVRVKQVCDSAAAFTRYHLRDRARLVKDYTVDPIALADEGRLFQILLNLLVNAAQAIERGDPTHNEVILRIGWGGIGVRIEVQDTGRGIPEGLQGRVFEPFFTTRGAAGSGLGLALCRQYTEEVGGRLTFATRPGLGTTFVLELPAAEEQIVATQTLVPDPAGAGKANVMVVDDDPLVGRAIKRVLRRDKHDVLVVTHGVDAITWLERGERFDIVFCDVVMPGMTGVDLFKRVQAAWPSQAPRFVFMTGGNYTEEDRVYLDALPNTRLTKPLGTAQIRTCVSEALLT